MLIVHSKGEILWNLTKILSKGKNCTVYKKGEYAIKLFRKDYPKDEVFNEALISARVESTGLNIPRIKEVSEIDGQWSITMDCIEGKTIEEIITEKPKDIDKYINMMIDLQMEMHTKKCPSLGKLRNKMSTRINQLDCLDKTVKYELLTRLDSAPKHTKLCHGDFTTLNIIISDKDKKPYILDWNHATVGNASADIARTFLWLSMYHSDISDKYIKMFCDKSNTALSYVQRWLPVVAAARLFNNVPDEKDLIMKWIDVVEYE